MKIRDQRNEAQDKIDQYLKEIKALEDEKAGLLNDIDVEKKATDEAMKIQIKKYNDLEREKDQKI